MLGKLLKYEFYSTARLLLPLYGALLIVAGVFSLELRFITKLPDVAGIVTGLLYASIIIATLCATFIMLLQRFYKNLLGDEGYLMLTLPTTLSAHIFSKLIPATVWTLLSAIVAAFSGLIIAAARTDVFDEIAAAIADMPSGSWTFVVSIIIMVLVTTAASVLHIYAAIAIGHQVNRRRTLCAVGAYIGISIVVSAITSTIGVLAEKYGLLERLMDMALFNDMSELATVNLFIWAMTLANFIFGAVMYIVAQQLLTRRLNLE